MKKLKIIIRISQAILILSGIMDLYLWLTINYHIPSWSMGITALCIAIILETTKEALTTKKHTHNTHTNKTNPH